MTTELTMTEAAPNAKKRVVRNHARKLACRKFYLDMSLAERADFCRRAKTTEGYVHQIYGGWTLGSVFVVQRIDEASAGRIPAWYLRPDVFAKPVGAPNLR